jgi:transcriptional regulator with GAF, ATPase, and Fis domain
MSSSAMTASPRSLSSQRDLRCQRAPWTGLRLMIGRATCVNWKNVVERALIQQRGGILSFETLLAPRVIGGREGTGEASRSRTLPPLDEINAEHIRQVLQMAGGKINGPGGAAQLLGLHPNTLRKRMNKLGIPYGRKSWQPFSRG